jgi:hypothetical protein
MDIKYTFICGAILLLGVFYAGYNYQKLIFREVEHKIVLKNEKVNGIIINKLNNSNSIDYKILESAVNEKINSSIDNDVDVFWVRNYNNSIEN